MTPRQRLRSLRTVANTLSVKTLLAATCLLAASAGADVTVYTAQHIVTMEPAMPHATAVAVEDGRIVAVGSAESLEPILSLKGGNVDTRFSEQVLVPGFIDPHVHPMLPAVLTQFPFLAPDDWSLPTGEFPGARDPASYRQRLSQLVDEYRQGNQANPHQEVPFITWGYHPLWHGDIDRNTLNRWFGDTPVLLWHRSFHEMIGNDAAWRHLGITETDTKAIHEADWERGHFWEGGLKAIVPKFDFLFAPQRFGQGMANFLAMMHQAGVTTALDMGTGIFGDPIREIQGIKAVAANYPIPSRIILTPIILDFIGRQQSPEQALAEVREWQQSNNDRVQVGNHFKLMLDGAIFSGLSQMGPPGYLDGHHGVWMAPKDLTYNYAQTFWNAGFQLHAHSNGDAATDWFIELLKTLYQSTPRLDHRMTLEHFAYSTEDQTRQLKALGAAVSANPYYHYILSELYADDWLGPDRAQQMVRLGSVERAGIPLALHSDSPMAPLSPLTLMWSAVARQTIEGNAGIATEQLSRAAALKAVTIDAAFVIGREADLGSIRAGKIADFTVLSDNPLTVDLDQLRQVQVIATVFAGKPYSVAR